MLVGHPCQVLEVHVVIAVGALHQGVHHHLMPIALRHKAEWMIHRRLYDDLVARRQQGAHSHSYPLDNAGDEAHPLFSHLPPVMLLHPADDGVPVVLGQTGVAIEGVLHPVGEGFGDEGRRLPVHVGHPQGNQVSTVPHLGEPCVLHIASARAVDGLVEIVCHQLFVFAHVLSCSFTHKGKHLSHKRQAFAQGLCHTEPFLPLRHGRQKAVNTF